MAHRFFLRGVRRGTRRDGSSRFLIRGLGRGGQKPGDLYESVVTEVGFLGPHRCCGIGSVRGSGPFLADVARGSLVVGVVRVIGWIGGVCFRPSLEAGCPRVGWVRCFFGSVVGRTWLLPRARRQVCPEQPRCQGLAGLGEGVRAACSWRSCVGLGEEEGGAVGPRTGSTPSPTGSRAADARDPPPVRDRPLLRESRRLRRGSAWPACVIPGRLIPAQAQAQPRIFLEIVANGPTVSRCIGPSRCYSPSERWGC